MSQHQYMSRQEAARILGVADIDIDRLINIGLLDRYRIRGWYVRVRRVQVDELAALDPALLRDA